MDRQTLRGWVHHFNASGPEGLIDRTEGPKPRLSEEQLAQFAKIVGSTGPDREKEMASSGGGASISSVSLSKGSASTFIRAMSESS